MGKRKYFSLFGFTLTTILPFLSGVSGLEANCSYAEGALAGCTDNSYKLASGNDCTVNTECTAVSADATGTNKGYLYYCKDNRGTVTCELVDKVGYYISADNVYTCVNDSNEIKCYLTSNGNTAYVDSQCDAVDNGQLNIFQNIYFV